MKNMVIFCFLLCMAAPVFGQVQGSKEPLVFANAEEQERFNRLTTELRCLVCQNQNLADSDAPLAHDLRTEVFNMMEQGLSDDQIKQFLVERYGDFVLYLPPVKGNTLLLWAAPAILLLGGAVVIFFSIRQRRRLVSASDQEGAD